MKKIITYFTRTLVYAAIFFLTFSVSYTFALRYVPVTFTSMQAFKVFENVRDFGLKVDARWQPIENINMSMVRAVTASEDNNFLSHRGFDRQAIERAREYNKTHARKLGASTISQQTARSIFLPPYRTWVRKGLEGYLTFLMERMWSKKRIMEVYLNIIEVHPNVYGAEAAARRFYHLGAAKLNDHQASMITAALPNPRRMDIGRPSPYMKARSTQIRLLMPKMPGIDLMMPGEDEPRKK